MFNKIINYKGFWKSTLFLAIAATVVLFMVNWGLSGFESVYFDTILNKLVAFFVGGAIYGFTMTYVKYYRKLKEQENRKK